MTPIRTRSRWLHRNLVFPAIVRARGEGDLYPVLEELRALDDLSAERLRERQTQRLVRVLTYAGERCSLYRERWSGWVPSGPQEALAELGDLPYTTKQDLQENGDRITAHPRPSRVSRKTTGGSTGEPVTVLKDREATARNRAAFWYGVGWFGVRIGDRGARFWGSPRQLGWRRLRFDAADVAMNRLRFSAFAFDETDLEDYWHEAVSFSVDYFYGYVSMIEAFARHVERKGYDGGRLGLKSIVTTAEVLTPPQRRLLQRTFDAPVQDEYGCGEVGPIAYQCEHGALHVMTENVFLEVITDDGRPARPGEEGELVVTDLHNRAMPLIRYRLGDYGVKGEGCRCGRSFPVLRKIWGREYDFVQAPDGTKYHGEFFLYLFEDLRDAGVPVRQFRVTQVGERELQVEVSTDGGNLGTEPRTTITSRLRGELTGMRFELSTVGTINRAASGKMRVVRNPWLRNGGG